MYPKLISRLKLIFVVAMVLALLRLFHIPNVTPIYALLITGIGFVFAPVLVIFSLLDRKLNGEVKAFTVLTCFYVCLICGNSAIFHLFEGYSLAYKLVNPIISILLFAASEYVWLRGSSTSKHSISELRSFGRWFLPLLFYPFVYNLVNGIQ